MAATRAALSSSDRSSTRVVIDHREDDAEALLADIAAELGYADQAHLANDFRAVLGFTATDDRPDP